PRGEPPRPPSHPAPAHARRRRARARAGGRAARGPDRRARPAVGRRAPEAHRRAGRPGHGRAPGGLMGRRLAIAALLLLGLGRAAGGQSSQATSQSPGRGSQPVRTPDRPAVAVTTAVAEARAVQRSVETVGSLVAWDEVVAKSQAIGTVVRL